MFHRFLGALIIALCGFVSSVNAENIPLRDDEIATINSVSAYLKSFGTMQGNFVQVAPNGGTTGGKFWIRRPGFMRFEYDAPEKLLIIADGTWVGVVDLKIKSKADRYPLGETPLDFILSDDPDIMKKTNIRDFYYEPGNLMITMSDKAGKMKGSLTMVFGGEDLHLSSWTITDEHGRQTSIYISDLVVNQPIAGGYFALHRY